MKGWRRGGSCCAIGVSLGLALLAQPAAVRAQGASAFGSAVDPSYEVLLPDPEPPSEQQAQRADASASDTELDIAQRVLSAAKQVTTVQEAPSIVTVVTADEVERRGFRTLGQILATIPGWVDVSGGGHLLNLPLVRGTPQAALLLRDGVSMFEPALNAGQFNRSLPLETIKRFEVVTGPGGVLWGANSFLGIVNAISKDAEDINGAQAGVGYGDGPGAPQSFRVWALFGKSFTVRGRLLKVVQHVSYENYLSPQISGLVTLQRSPAPQPPGPTVFGGAADAHPLRSYVVNLDGHLSYGPLSLHWAYPLGEMNQSLSFGNTLALDPVDAKGMSTGAGMRNKFTILDRYVTLQYKDRFLRDRIGLDVKAYGIEFLRDLGAVTVPPSVTFPQGVNFFADVRSYRVGASIDGDVSLPLRNRLLLGGDVFHEWVPEAQVTFPDVATPGRLPLACPIAGGTYDNPAYVPACPLTFIYGASRTVLALYLSDQFRPVSRLTLDAGVRYQAGLGQRGYSHAPIGNNGLILGSGSVVWNFYSDMHLKANYATGFRPPVFNNTDSNGAAVQFRGNSALQNESSQAFQGEWNGRLLKGVGPIRELQLRADYSFTQLDALITIADGSYSNVVPTTEQLGSAATATRRVIHSAEAAARLYLKDHMLTFGYTFLHITTNDRGLLRSVPQHWASIGAVLSLWPGHLDGNVTLNLIGGYDDPNRLRTLAVAGGITVAPFSELTFDRLPPQAILNFGVRARFFKNRLWVSGNAYNALDQRVYYPDVFYDLTPTLETTPTPAPGWSCFFEVGGKPW